MQAWTDGRGRVYPLKEMADKHITTALHILRIMARVYCKQHDVPSSQWETYVDDGYEALVEEAKRRGLSH